MNRRNNSINVRAIGVLIFGVLILIGSIGYVVSDNTDWLIAMMIFCIVSLTAYVAYKLIRNL